MQSWLRILRSRIVQSSLSLDVKVFYVCFYFFNKKREGLFNAFYVYFSDFYNL